MAIGILSWVALTLLKDSGAVVEVKVDGQDYSSYSLSENQEISIKSKEGHNRLVIKDGKAYVDEADCRDGLCIKQGKISKGGENIVCLPHKTVITIKGGEEKQVDGGAQ